MEKIPFLIRTRSSVEHLVGRSMGLYTEYSNFAGSPNGTEKDA